MKRRGTERRGGRDAGSARPRILRCGGAMCAIALGLACRGDGPRPPTTGGALGAALQRGLAVASQHAAPWPCAVDDPVVSAAAPAGWRAGPDTLTLAAVQPSVTVGVVADGGGASPATLDKLRQASESMAAQGVSLVLSLGGLAEQEVEITAALRALASDRYLLVAIPGDLEPATAHRAAVARLAGEGLRVADGSRTRLLELGVATLAMLPGAGAAEQLGAGAEGCGFTDADVAQLARRLGQAPGLRILASWAAPRPRAVTEAQGALPLRQLLEQHRVELALAGEPTGPREPEGVGVAGAGLQVAFPGFVDGQPRMPMAGALPHPTALLLQLGAQQWRWQRLDLAMQPAR